MPTEELLDNGFAISNDPGLAGAALSRNRAERENGANFCSVEFCAENHMQWFAPNYRRLSNII